jgi:adenylate cyclase
MNHTIVRFLGLAKILILDDNPQVIRHVRMLLKEFGHESAFLVSPTALEERVREENFDLILLDYHLGKITAIEVLGQLKSLGEQAPPTLVMTGDHDENLLARCLSAGAIDFITKPISSVILSSRIEAGLDRARYLRLLENHRDELNRLVEKKTAELHQTNTELQRVNEVFSKFVPDAFTKHIWRQKEVSIGYYEEKVMSVMFLDVRGYTSLSEKMSPGETLTLLNSIFGHFESPLHRHGAIVEKFMGDGILILFPHSEETHCNPIDCAIDLQNEVQDFNRQREKDGMKSIQIGIGINTGLVMMGALGMPSRFNSTVIADAVNLASRIQGLTSKYHCQILISDSTHHQHNQANHFIRLLDQVRVKGKSQKVFLYEVFNTDQPQKIVQKEESRSYLETYHENFSKREFAICLDLMKEMVEKFPEDVVGIELLKRSSHFLRFPPGETWDGAVNTDFNFNLRRQSQRIEMTIPPENIEVLECLKAGGKKMLCTLLNISREGLLIRTVEPLPVKCLLKFKIQLQQGSLTEDLELFGQNVWSKSNQDGWEQGVQIIFSRLKDVQSWVHHLNVLEKDLGLN